MPRKISILRGLDFHRFLVSVYTEIIELPDYVNYSHILNMWEFYKNKK